MKIYNNQVCAHSFPRRQLTVLGDDEIDTIRLQLTAFLRNGPLLVPELVEIPGIEGTPRTEQSFLIMQDRFCLTMTNTSMINEHMNLFGPVTVIFTPQSIIRAGAVPVIYFPGFELRQNENSLGLSSVHNLRAAISFLLDFIELQAMDRSEYRELLGLDVGRKTFRGNKAILDRFLEVTHRDQKNLKNTVGALQTLSELFYPTERNRDINAPTFQYFSQREWRILSGMRINGEDTSISVDSELRELLLRLDNSFFNERLYFDNEAFRRIDRVQGLSRTLKKHVMSGILAIYCRPVLTDMVKDCVRELDLAVDIVSVPQ